MTQDGQAITRDTLAEIVTAPSDADADAEADLSGFIAANRARLEKLIQTKGAVLFRGFAVSDAARLRDAVVDLCGQPWQYIEGSSERRQVGDAVYTSTEYPPQYAVSLHNELSYARRWPGRLGFCCVQAPASGGQTPLADSRRILGGLPRDLVAEFDRRGIAYVRNLRSQDAPGLGLSWQAVWETDSREQVEAYCAQDGIDITWTEDGSLRTRQIRPATARHPQTGEKVWFNQVDQFHPTNLGAEAAADLLEVLGPEELPLDATFGDGGPIPPEMIDIIRTVSWSEATAFDWREGDLLVIDNMLTAHGRTPFEGSRRVLVAMA